MHGTGILGTTIRQLILVLLLFGMTGTTAELVLLEHFEDWRQKLPLGLLSLGAISAVLALARPSKSSLRFLQATMLTLVGAGVLGVYYHYVGNAEFELEMRPAMRGLELVKESLMGAFPALAPGAMVQFGLLGLLHTFRHPLLTDDKS